MQDQDASLLQQTVLRLCDLSCVGSGTDLRILPTLIVCHEDQRFLTLEQIETVGGAIERILLEPVSRNTAPALTYAALFAVRDGADPVLVAMPADHAITDTSAFHGAIGDAVSLSETGTLVTLGVVPTAAETGYGYIRKAAEVESHSGGRGFAIDAFVEKPGEKAAASFVASGDYLWNSGIFVTRASVWLEAIDQHRPDILGACRGAMRACEEDGYFVRIDAAEFEACPSDSIDYAVMERIARSERKTVDDSRQAKAIPAAVVPMSAGWSDVGSWRAVLELSGDAAGNAVRGDVFELDVQDSLLLSHHRLVVGIGLRDTVVIETADAVLVADKARAEDVRQVVDWLNDSAREEGRSHRRVLRPWGSYENLDAGERFLVKRLTVKPNAALSLQLYHHRAEHWVVVRGTAKVTKDEEEFLLTENQSTYIPVGVKHRLENPGSVALEVIEVQSGGYLGEDDIVRFEDRYGR